MSDALPVAYLARHGETAWTISRQHTGVTDLPLTAQGEVEARQLGERLEGLAFAGVLTSPLQRAVRTCELAGFGSAAQVEPDLIASPAPTSMPSALTGSCSAMVAREGSRPTRSGRAPTVWRAVRGQWAAPCCSFRADISSECSPRAGSGSNRGRAGTSC